MIYKLAIPLAVTAFIAGCSDDAVTTDLDANNMDSDTPFPTLLAEANDFDLVNGTFIKIGDRYGHWVDASQYTPEERVIMLVWHSSGIIDNGGFEYLFSSDFDGDPEFKITAEAYKTVGLTRGYEAFQDAFKVFPNGKVPHESEERIQQYQRAADSVRDEINTKHWKDGWEDLREKMLAKYIRDNVTKLGDLDAAQ
ncbi:MAG: DUF4375 domain-containing protein [Planctomycetaceae bacterium]|nr:DUF4375 domain-containing protein [Planctomycetaceae bacterium]